jgi:hypothetical protein
MFCKIILLINFLFASDVEMGPIASSSSHEIEQGHASDEITYHTVTDLLTALRKEQRKEQRKELRRSQQAERDACCGPAQSCRACCCTEWKVLTRFFWTVTASTTWTVTALTDYVRRSMIPLAALGQFDKPTQDMLLTWIGILQVVSETCEVIHDFSTQHATATQKKWTQLHLSRKLEKEYLRSKALRACAKRTIPHLRLDQDGLSPIEAKHLRRLYEPESRALKAVEEELAERMELTGCERGYQSAMRFFWVKSYPVFWVLGVGLAMAQMLVIATDLVQDEDTLALSILILTVEALQYFSKRMKNMGMNTEYQENKLRKRYTAEDPV